MASTTSVRCPSSNATKMSRRSRRKCIYIISSCVCFLLLLYVASLGHGQMDGVNNFARLPGFRTFTLTLFPSETVKCRLHNTEYGDDYGALSLVSLIQATSKDKGLELHGLPVYLNLKNACQPLDDVSKANIQVHKVALVTLVNKTACPFQLRPGGECTERRLFCAYILHGLNLIFSID